MSIEDERSRRWRRWRLILGGGEADGPGVELRGADLVIDNALRALYDSEPKGGLGNSASNIARWLGDIRRTPDLFPELMAAAINRQDISQWAAAREIAIARGGVENSFSTL